MDLLPFVLVPLLALGAAVAADTAPGGRGPILLFGDSIGAGSTLPGGKAQDAWAALLAKRGYTIVNRSVGGRATGAVKDFTAALAEGPAPDAVIIALGTNDSRDLAADMAQRAVAHIDAMVAAARAAQVRKVVILGPPNINKEKLGASYGIRDQRDANLVALTAAYAAYAKEKGCGFIPLYGKVPAESLTADGVHPDKAGHLALVEVIAAALPDLLR